MRRNRVTVVCKNCGKIYEVIKARELETKYCSASCHGKAVLSKIDPMSIPRKRGADNRNWKGGRRKHTQGYVWVLFEGKYILEHRHIMQQHIGRILISSEQVHHKNGIKLDNRIENLELITLREHVLQHHREGHYKPMGWSRKYSACRLCNSSLKPHRARGLCRKCYRSETGK